MHARHVEPLVRVRDHVAEPGGALEPPGQIVIQMARVSEAAKRVGVVARRAELQPETCGEREIDDDLNRLPQMQDDGVRRVRRWRELRRVRRQPLRDPREMSLDRGGLLGEDLAIETAQCASSASTSS